MSISREKQLIVRSSSVPDTAPRCLGVREAAIYLGSTIWAVRSLAWERKLPFIRLGQRLLFDRQDLDRYIERSKVPSLNG
jgi:excisionase family DNA binding protein